MAISKKEVWYALKETIAGDKETREKLLEVKKDIVKEYIESIKKDKRILSYFDIPFQI